LEERGGVEERLGVGETSGGISRALSSETSSKSTEGCVLPSDKG